MPAENRRRPRYFACSTTSPRSTAISVSRSSVATSIAISRPSSVVSSSALRKRGLRMVTSAALPRRSSVAPSSASLPSLGEAPAVFGRLRPRQQHGVTQMHAGRGMGENVREQQALIDLGAVLVALCQAVFARQFLVVGHQTRQQRRRLADQMFDADEFREIMRQAAIDRLGMGCAEIFPAPCGRAARSRRRRMLAPRSARACPEV